MADIHGRGLRWDECGHPQHVAYSQRRTPPKPCGKPTVDGVACAKHAARVQPKDPDQ